MLSKEHLDKLMDMGAPERFVIGSESVRHITHEHRVAKNLKSVAKLVRQIVEGNDPLFYMGVNLRREDVVRGTPLGHRLIDAATKRLPEIEEYFPSNAYIEFVELLRSATRASPRVELIQRGLRDAKGSEAVSLLFALMSLVDRLRQEGRSAAFTAALDKRRRQCEKNQHSAKDYEAALFRCRSSRLLAIRLDLACGSEEPGVRGITMTVGTKQAREELNRLVRFVREKYDMVGFMGSFEYGLLTGYHFHMLFFLDGHKHCRAAHLAKLFGEHWRNVITEGRGRYYNCNTAWYRENGIGIINHYDVAKRKTLITKVIPYLTKMDFWIRFHGVKKGFFKGVMPTIPLTGGRPRHTPSGSGLDPWDEVEWL
jgi:hypothetical protein